MPKYPRPQKPIYHSQKDMSPPLYSEEIDIEVNLFMSTALQRNRIGNSLGLISADDILSGSGDDFYNPLPVLVSDQPSCKMPTWSALNSMLSPKRAVTKVASPPLIAAPDKFQTLLRVLKQAQGINVVIMGKSRRTVISDVGLYHPAKQLQMYRNK